MGEIVYLSEGEMIETIIRNAYEKSCRNDWTCIEDIKCLDIPQTHYLHWCVAESLFNNLNGFRLLEKDVYQWFKENYKNVLGDDYEIVKHKNNNHHMPDFWVLYNHSEIIPVECKLNNFNLPALRQIKRYMSYYKCNKGIAIASECNVQLPNNILFIKHGIIK